jgi:hypothetical protein
MKDYGIKVPAKHQGGERMVVTKADIYDEIIFAKRPVCPYCGQEMKISECVETGLTCGSGWGTPYLFVCVNDECPPFVNGWENMRRDYGRRCSYRCICFPDSRKTELMMVLSPADVASQIIEEETIRTDRARGTLEDPEVRRLAEHFEARNIEALLSSLFDHHTHYKVRQKAAEFIGEAGLVEALEPLRNHRYEDQRVAVSARDAIRRIYKVTGTRECPFCAEVVDVGAAVCSECGRDLTGS